MQQNKPDSVESVIENATTVQKKSRSGCLIAFLVLLLVGFFITICGFVFIVSMAASASNSDADLTEEYVLQEGGEEKAAVINIAGVITSSGSANSIFSSTAVATPSQVISDIDRALEDDDVKVIILNIESPGGEVVASDIIYNKVIEARIEKPVIAYSTTMMASGGYYIAAGANEIMTHPGVLTGSIGVIMQTSSMEGLYEKVGIETKTFKSAEFKDNQNLFDENSDGELENIYQELIDENYDTFVSAIVSGRDMDENLVRELGDGRIYSGRQASENGLVDSLGYYEDLYTRAEEIAGTSNLTIVEYGIYDFWGSFFGSNSAFTQVFGSTPLNEYSIKSYYLISL